MLREVTGLTDHDERGAEPSGRIFPNRVLLSFLCLCHVKCLKPFCSRGVARISPFSPCLGLGFSLFPSPLPPTTTTASLHTPPLETLAFS